MSTLGVLFRRVRVAVAHAGEDGFRHVGIERFGAGGQRGRVDGCALVRRDERRNNNDTTALHTGYHPSHVFIDVDDQILVRRVRSRSFRGISTEPRLALSIVPRQQRTDG